MKLRGMLPVFAVLVLLVDVLAAQKHPDPTQARLATVAHLAALTQSDFNALLAQAKSSHPEAQYWVAMVHEHGRLVPKDVQLSREWMLKSAERGYAPAQEEVGGMYLWGTEPDYGKADMWLRRAAVQGNVEAQFWLGAAYEDGRIGARDYREALKWLRKAADQRDPDAQYMLGQMYEEGEGVPQNYSLAARWYRKAAEHIPDLGGAGHGRNSLAHLYMRGLGVPKNYALAYMWFAVAGFNPEEAASHITPAQVAQAQRMAQDWITRHIISALQQGNALRHPDQKDER